MHVRLTLLTPLLALLLACAPADKYPYPPQFVTVEQASPHVLPAPPAAGSAEYAREIESILARQARLTDGQIATLGSEDPIQPEMIVLPVLGSRYTEARYPALYRLLKHAASDAWRIADTAQDYYQSPRPWYADSRVRLYVPSITRPGYPSGHTTTNSVWAYVLSELFPGKRDALFQRAIAIGNHRVDAGAHFPHDIEAGRTLAAVIYAKMRENPAYRHELAAAKAELNKSPSY